MKTQVKLNTKCVIKYCLIVLMFFQSFPLLASIPVALNGQAVPSLAPLLKRVSPAVVNIATFAMVTRYNPLLQDPFFRRFFNVPDQPKKERRAQSAGSGVIINAKKGYVITNNHVIKGADEIDVTLKDGRTFKAKLLGKDKQVDLALLQIPAKNLKELTLAESNHLQVGDFVVAIGNPFALGQTVTSGIVSALGRTGLGIEGYEDFIQTDASINPGNSGGALINLKGELEGINSAIIAPSGGNVGIGFAIPSDIVRSTVAQLLKFGEVRRGRLGIQFQDLTPELAKAFSLNLNQGAVISKVYEGSSAEKSGLRAGDIVTSVNGRKISDGIDLRNSIGLTPVGQIMKMKILRDGKPLTINAKVEVLSRNKAEGENFCSGSYKSQARFSGI